MLKWPILIISKVKCILFMQILFSGVKNVASCPERHFLYSIQSWVVSLFDVDRFYCREEQAHFLLIIIQFDYFSALSTRGSTYWTESPPSNYYIGGSTCMTSMYRVTSPYMLPSIGEFTDHQRVCIYTC